MRKALALAALLLTAFGTWLFTLHSAPISSLDPVQARTVHQRLAAGGPRNSKMVLHNTLRRLQHDSVWGRTRQVGHFFDRLPFSQSARSFLNSSRSRRESKSLSCFRCATFLDPAVSLLFPA